MFFKKFLSTAAGLALVSGALLGVSSPAHAEDAVAGVGGEITPTEVSGLPSEPVPVAQEENNDTAPSDEPEPSSAQSQLVTQTQAAARGPASSSSRPDNDKKAWVCKFVASIHSPSGYVLKEGKQPISVSVNALGPDVNSTGTFKDEQPSFVVPTNDASLCSHTEILVEDDIVCPTGNVLGVVNVTTTITLYYGTTPAVVTIEHSTRELTSGELDECPPPPSRVFVCEFVASESHPSGWALSPGPQPKLVDSGDLGTDVNPTGDFDPITPSFIVAADDSALCASATKVRNTEITCPTAQAAGFATVTTTRTYFYGTIRVDVRIVDKVRELTRVEARDCPPVVLGAATAEVSFADPTCFAAQTLILGAIVNATWGEVTAPDGDGYLVTATAHEGYEFEGGTAALTFTGTLAEQLDPLSDECDLETLALVMPAVTFTQATCGTAGSYTLGAEPSYDPALLTFTVNGVAGIEHGSFPVSDSGLVLVTAQAKAPHGLEVGWSDPAGFMFEVPSDADCATPADVQLPTLAFTGSDSTPQHGWWLAASLIALGSAVAYVRRRTEGEVL